MWDEPIKNLKKGDGESIQRFAVHVDRLSRLDQPRREMCACGLVPKGQDGACFLPAEWICSDRGARQ